MNGRIIAKGYRCLAGERDRTPGSLNSLVRREVRSGAGVGARAYPRSCFPGDGTPIAQSLWAH